MAMSSTFITPLSTFNPSSNISTTAARFPSKITAAYTTTTTPTNRSSSTSHYEILGLQTSASHQEIKQAYRKLARVSHPDVVASSSSSADEFIKIHSAYATLSDPAKRADYDRTMLGKTRGVLRSFEMATTPYGYARAADTTAFSHRRWETDQCW